MNKDNIEKETKTPIYLKFVNTIYQNDKLCNLFDKDWFLQIITFGNRKKLIQALLREIEQNQTVLQVGATFGSQIEKVAKKVGYYGNYDLIEVSQKQFDRAIDKYKGIQHNMNFSNQNGLAKIEKKYDVSISFMMLHELPPFTRREMINQIISTTKESGRAIFVDYHKPKNTVLRWLFKIFNRVYQPFVENFWEEDIQEMTKGNNEFSWHKYTIMNDCYQIVVADRIHSVLKD